MIRNVIMVCISCFCFNIIQAQGVTVEGYAFEKDNRGFLNQVLIELVDQNGTVQQRMDTNQDGFFALMLDPGFKGTVRATKSLFFERELNVDASGKAAGEKMFLKIEMERKPGYIFDVTIAPARDSSGQQVGSIPKSWVEIYNNTTEEQVLNLKDYTQPNFQYTFVKGNHYTVMVRADGYFTKRMEAFVDVKGCILCFEGIGDVRPSVTDNLTQGNEMGTLLANVELQPAEVDDKLVLRNLYYDYNKWEITEKSAEELDNLIEVLRDNPSIILELGSHTDSRGDTPFNQELSSKRATAVVDYLVANGIESRRIVARGYGESQLVNGCDNSSDCTEKEHAANRRTELKVIGFLREDPLANKTLAEIKEEERYAALLAEVQAGGQVMQIEAGEELPEEIKRDLEKQRQRAGEKKDDTDETLSEELKQAITEVKESVDGQELQQLTEDAETDQDGSLNDRLKAGETINVPGVTIGKPQETTDTTVVDYETGRYEVKPSGLIPILPDFSGIKAQVLVSSSIIPDDHELILQYGTVYIYDTGTAFAYFIGDFNSQEEARAFIAEQVADKYPGAFMVTIVDGKRQ